MANSSLQFQVDVKELMAFSRKLSKAERVTSLAIAASLNVVGDGVLATLSQQLADETGLMIEQVRAFIRVKRANRNSLDYTMQLQEALLERELSKLEGKRESKDFGKRDPKELVIIVSKKDELVCMDCEELASAGPMPLEVAMEHIPKHPNCRCVILPYVTKKRLPVTMTTISGTSAQRRSGRKGPEQDRTLRQLAQTILDRTAKDVRIELR